MVTFRKNISMKYKICTCNSSKATLIESSRFVSFKIQSGNKALMKVPVETMLSASFIDIWRPFGMIVSSFHDIFCPNPVIVSNLWESGQLQLPATLMTKRVIYKISILERRVRSLQGYVNTYRQSHFQSVIQRYYIFACPNVIEKPIHDIYGLIPDKFIIALAKIKSSNKKPVTIRISIRTWEKAGADIFLYFFHSSPSQDTILGP